MTAKIDTAPRTETETGLSTAPLLTKREVAALMKLTPRTINGFMDKGLPHLKVSANRCRFIEADVIAWLRTNYGVQRLGKLNA